MRSGEGEFAEFEVGACDLNTSRSFNRQGATGQFLYSASAGDRRYPSTDCQKLARD